MKKEAEVTVHACGPSRPDCRCGCPDGECGHRWDGPTVTSTDKLTMSVSCSRCGMLAIDHDMWVAP